MQSAHRNKVTKQFLHILNQHYFHTKTLQTISLKSFTEMVDVLANTILPFNSTQKTTIYPADRMQLLMEVIRKQQEEPTLNSIAKKMIILFVMLRRLAQEDALDEQMQNVFLRHLTILLKEELPCVGTEISKKRPSSISKIYSYIRQLSGSKERPSQGKTALQSDIDKGGIKEIVSAIFQPFCCYLLKMLQNHEAYSSILKHNDHPEASLLWTMVNSAQTLGQIVEQLHRFARYFIYDLLGILVYLTFCVCKDLSIYYDALAGELQIQAEEFHKLIEEQERELRQGGQRKVFKMVAFQQTKGLIDEFLTIREKIHYMFGNKSLKNYRYYFSKPAKYNLREDKNAESLQLIQQYHKRATRWNTQVHSLKTIDKTTQPYLFLVSSQIFLSKEKIKQDINEGLNFGGGDLEYKLTNTIPCKPRINNWLNRTERNKHAGVPPNITTCKDDPISTSSNE